ncbi:MAG: PilN domain-containing protein [Planctomycetes bacterium]|nr:PilN domain-containing protein [Planctomycetota bacterium]
MQTIDFLPQKFRERATFRLARIWQCVVLGLFGSVVLATLFYQVVSRGGTRARLTEVTPQHSLAVQQALRHTELRTELGNLQHQVSLYTFLQHPWPRTQVLDGISSQLPASCVLTSLRVVQEVPKATTVIVRPSAAQVELQGAEHDVKQLLESLKGAQAIVYVNGVTENAVELHEFVARLAQSELFYKAELRSFESARESTPRGGKFEIRAVLSPPHFFEAGQGDTQRPAAAAPAYRIAL